MIVLVGIYEEETLGFYAPALRDECREQFGAQIGKAFEYHVDLMEAFALGNLVNHFEDGAFWRGHRHRPTPGALRQLRIVFA